MKKRLLEWLGAKEYVAAEVRKAIEADVARVRAVTASIAGSDYNLADFSCNDGDRHPWGKWEDIKGQGLQWRHKDANGKDVATARTIVQQRRCPACGKLEMRKEHLSYDGKKYE